MSDAGISVELRKILKKTPKLTALDIKKLEKAIYKVLSKDTQILDWLESMSVQVRIPLRWGSGELFWVRPEDLDGEEGPSNLRARCLLAMKERKKYDSTNKTR